MRKCTSMILVALAILFAPAAAEAKRYNSEGGVKHRSLTGYAHKKRKGQSYASSSHGCLSSEARNLLGRIQNRFGNVQIISTCRPGARIATSGRPSKHAGHPSPDCHA